MKQARADLIGLGGNRQRDCSNLDSHHTTYHSSATRRREGLAAGLHKARHNNEAMLIRGAGTLTVELEEIENFRQAGVLVHGHHAVRKYPYPQLRNRIVEKTSLFPKRCHQELRAKQGRGEHSRVSYVRNGQVDDSHDGIGSSKDRRSFFASDGENQLECAVRRVHDHTQHPEHATCLRLPVTRSEYMARGWCGRKQATGGCVAQRRLLAVPVAVMLYM